MKKIILASAVAAMALVSCTKEIAEVAPAAVRVNGLELVGQIAPDTKLAIGELSGDFYPLVWTAGDKIGIYNCTEGSDMKNISATLNSKSDGLNSGVFVVEDEFSLAEGVNDLIVYYPYNVTDSTKIDVAAKEATQFLISSEQKQAKANSSASLGAYSFAYATAKMDTADPDTKPSFTLQHASTYVKIVVSSSEFSSYKLERVSISDKSASPASVSGLVTVNIPDGTTSIKNGLPYAAVTVQEPATLESAQEVYLSVLPCDFTGKKAYLSFTMSKDDKTVTIPIEIDGKQLKANALNIIEVKDLKLSDNKCSWFEPVETRYLAGGWSYGESNTIFYKTTVGASSIATAESVNFSVKARGDFAGAEEPAYVTIMFACHQNPTGNWNHISINDEVLSSDKDRDLTASGYTAKKFNLKSDCSFDIKVAKAGDYQGWAGKILLYGKNNQLIWAFNLWGALNDIKEIPVGDFVMADKSIGGAAFTEDASHRAGRGASYYFAWGRPFGFGWGAATRPVEVTQCTDLAYSAHKANIQFKYSGNQAAGIDWYVGQSGKRLRSDRRDDLWGNANATNELNPEKGTKSVFDPCPKGWMVPCPTVLETIAAGATIWPEGTTANGFWMVYGSGENALYFAFDGCLWGETGGNSNNNKSNICAMWSNSTATNYSNSADGATLLWWKANNDLAQNVRQSASSGRSSLMPVRCMKDVENR